MGGDSTADYTATELQLSIPAGNVQSEYCVEFNVNDDPSFEGEELFTVSVSLPAGTNTPVNIDVSQITVTIVDPEGKHYM